jgi:hypothetical protein
MEITKTKTVTNDPHFIFDKRRIRRKLGKASRELLGLYDKTSVRTGSTLPGRTHPGIVIALKHAQHPSLAA